MVEKACASVTCRSLTIPLNASASASRDVRAPTQVFSSQPPSGATIPVRALDIARLVLRGNAERLYGLVPP